MEDLAGRSNLRPPGDFGGQCLVGECAFDAPLLMPASCYLGLAKSGSYFYGTWRDPDGNLLRAMRGAPLDIPTFRFLFMSRPGEQLRLEEDAGRHLWSGPVTVVRRQEDVSFSGPGDELHAAFEFCHQPDSCSWSEGSVLSVSGPSLGPALQWFSTWPEGGCLSATAKYRTTGFFLGRRVEGFVGHEIHYLPEGVGWRDTPYYAGREVCWQQIANEYDDGSTIQGTFAYGTDGWGFAMLHDENGGFHCTTELDAEATVRDTGYPDTITYRFLKQSWTWRIDPQGERPPIGPGELIGADGTCTRDGDTRRVRYSMGNSDWWLDGRAEPIIRRR
jgi:hypothetical protein